jgi:predicted transcriptional regulator
MREKVVYTVGDIAAMTGLSRQTITRVFEGEPGVIIIERCEQVHRRGYRSIRIPNYVYQRVIQRYTVR